MEKHRITVYSVIIFILLISGCKRTAEISEGGNYTPGKEFNTPKYIFFFIGDGMASPQCELASAVLERIPDPGKRYGIKKLAFADFPVSGSSRTTAQNRYITGSAAAATALATGFKTSINSISMDRAGKKKLKTIARMAAEKGMKVGIVSSVSLDHATPACFYAHQQDRDMYSQIASQMAKSGFDYFAGGFLKAGNSGKIIEMMRDSGYTVVSEKEKFNDLRPGEKCWAYTEYDADAAMNYGIDKGPDEISLAEFTKKGIELLDSENGFFMMVEGGKIDWACHANDAATAVSDVVEFSRAVEEAVKFYNEHPDSTLIIVTGDHECGGLGLGYAATKYSTSFEILSFQKISFERFASKIKSWKRGNSLSFSTVLDSVEYYFGLRSDSETPGPKELLLTGKEIERLRMAYERNMGLKPVPSDKEDSYLLYAKYEPLAVTVTHILNNKAGIDWTSFKHTGLPVPVYALGQGQYSFTGNYPNNEIALRLMGAAGFSR
ncbi:MAG: alkaline phosphatase [Fibrobacterota bacterium]